MRAPSEQQALQQIPRRLADLLGLAPNDAKIRRQMGGALNADAVVGLGGFEAALLAAGMDASAATAAPPAVNAASSGTGLD